MICSFNFLIFLAVCLNIFTVINIKILANSNQQTQSYKFTSHIADFLSVVLITEMLEICIQTSYDQNVQLILKSYLPVVYGTPLIYTFSTLHCRHAMVISCFALWSPLLFYENSLFIWDINSHGFLGSFNPQIKIWQNFYFWWILELLNTRISSKAQKVEFTKFFKTLFKWKKKLWTLILKLI